ncbi:hypothetical protein FGIG_08296 [Fasciola gigantica]|uniref:Uncharacterized protein n=1 Tax=Fasciola gigantica TaxID=46835 RepID=A0A504XRB0_FASGI|nr:hypothetical protein FGIG_08296 [Fasciola gigantica]
MSRLRRSPSPRPVQIPSPMIKKSQCSPEWNTSLDNSTTSPDSFSSGRPDLKHLSLRAMFANKFMKNSADQVLRQNESNSVHVLRTNFLRAVSASPLASDNESFCQKSSPFEEKIRHYIIRSRAKYKSAPLSPVRRRLQRQMATQDTNALSLTPLILSSSTEESFDSNNSQHRCTCQSKLGPTNAKPPPARWYFIKQQYSFGEPKPRNCSRW